ncbi:Transmembrane prolyl 4-hydroxylase [Phytophthora nicotianae]|nr:Transmembrane prolyl 4-hydroxylase [Phytophthora nicotianae]
MPFEGENYSTPAINKAFAAAQKAFQSNVSALMCSSSFWGLRSSDQTTLWALGMLGQHHSWKNDGMVEFQSCSVGFPESKFGRTWKDRFYRTKLNHYDMQFKHGDGWFSKAKMPVKWLECLL